MEDKTQEKNKPEDISKCRPHDKGCLAKFLSYHAMTDDLLSMKEGTVMDCFYQSVFQLYNDDEKDGKIIE